LGERIAVQLLRGCKERTVDGKQLTGYGQQGALDNPVSYFIKVMRMVVRKGSTSADSKQHLLIMLGFAALFNGWAVISYRKRS
jgi:ABC-type multidrug transport system permease subunit